MYYGYNRLTQVYARAGRWKECVRAADSATTTSASPDIFVAICSAHLGDRARAQRVLAQIEARQYPDRVWVASILVALGDTARALSSLEQAFVDRSANLPTVRSDPLFAPLHDDPRFVAIFARMGLPLRGPPVGARVP